MGNNEANHPHWFEVLTATQVKFCARTCQGKFLNLQVNFKVSIFRAFPKLISSEDILYVLLKSQEHDYFFGIFPGSSLWLRAALPRERLSWKLCSSLRHNFEKKKIFCFRKNELPFTKKTGHSLIWHKEVLKSLFYISTIYVLAKNYKGRHFWQIFFKSVGGSTDNKGAGFGSG